MKAALTVIIFLLISSIAHAVTEIDVVIAYDTTHRDYWGDDGIFVEALSVLNFTEGVFSKSGMEVRFNLVHIFYEPGFTETGTAFEYFLSKRFTYTRSFGADLFIFFANDGWLNPKGRALLPGNYCFVNLNYFRDAISNTGWVVAHEIGHTFGGGHDSAHGEGLHPYSHAYTWNSGTGVLGTTLADGTIRNRNRVPFYSDPSLLYDGIPIGEPAFLENGEPNPMGADNRLTIEDYLQIAEDRESRDHYLWKDSRVLENGTHELDWFGRFDLNAWPEVSMGPAGMGRYLYHENLDWCWVPALTTLDNLWVWSHRFNSWVYLNQLIHRWGWVDDGETGWIGW
jgi:hypothetical protein